MQYWQRRLQRSVTDRRRLRSGRWNRSSVKPSLWHRGWRLVAELRAARAEVVLLDGEREGGASGLARLDQTDDAARAGHLPARRPSARGKADAELDEGI